MDDERDTVVVTFTGGLGAQLNSAAAYYLLEDAGEPVAADLRYFDLRSREAAPGAGGVSVWPWDLNEYGIARESFRRHDGVGRVVGDGAEKALLAEAGFTVPSIRDRFPIAEAAHSFVAGNFEGKPFGCLHVRRGDYLNVAAYMVSDEAYFRMARRISRLVPLLLVVSDTPVSPELEAMLDSLPIAVAYWDGGPTHLIHGLMRLSDILVCSNSQYSVTAGMLRDDDVLTFIPSRHIGDPADPLDLHLRDLAEFQALTRRAPSSV